MESTGYHFEGALNRLGGDEELFRELMIYFVEDAPELLHAIQVGLAAGNAGGIRRAAHSLRGLAANFDAEQAMMLAGSIEQIASKGDSESVAPLLADLEAEVQSLRDVLSRYPYPLQSTRPSSPKRNGR